MSLITREIQAMRKITPHDIERILKDIREDLRQIYEGARLEDIIVKSPWHDVRAYDAVGDGATDDATAIQAALDAAGTAGGGIVFFPEGTYNFGTTLTVSTKTGIVGAGPYASILNFTATDGTNAIECEGTGDDISTGTPKQFVFMREIAVKGNASSGHGIVFDIAKHCTFFNVYSLSHGEDCFHIGSPPVAASYLTRMGRMSMINCHTSGGTNSVYAAGGDIYIGGKSGFNDSSAIGIILEDMRTSYVNGVSGGSSDAASTHGIEIRNSAANNANAFDSHSIHLNDIHWEQLGSGDYFVNAAMTGTTELSHLSITNCEYSPRAAHGINLSGVVKSVAINHNYMISRRSVDNAIGITIGSSCEDINVGPNIWPYHLNINNSAAEEVLHCSEERSRATTAVSTVGAGEDDLALTTIYASYLETHGGLKIKAFGTKTGLNDNKTIKLYFGASSWTVHAAANNENDWRLEVEIINIATNSQKISWICWDGTTVAQGYETAAIDTTSAVVLKITGECTNAGDTITKNGWFVDRF